ncbi:DUF7287 family protein [Methanomethylovorans hollandica]
MDNNGQITVDYLVGITIFLLSLVFVFQYTNGLFTPFESSSDEVTMIADRVATTVVEDRISTGDPIHPTWCLVVLWRISSDNSIQTI